MPKAVDRDLLDCLRRPNPNVEYRVEISAPDVSKVLRRPDEFTSLIVPGSMTPANSMVTSLRGFSLAATPTPLASFAGTQSSFDLNREDIQRRFKGMRWTVDNMFSEATLRSFTARVVRATGLYTPPVTDFELQIFKWTRTPGTRGGFSWTQWVPTPLLSGAVVIKGAAINWVAGAATLTFDLSNYGIVLRNGPPDAVNPEQTSEQRAYHFAVRPVNPPALNSSFAWKIDAATSRTIAGVGTFERVFWNRESDQEQWIETAYTDVPSCTIEIDTYPPSGSVIHVIDLGRVPTSGTISRFVFERIQPSGTSATAEISYAGSGGPWTPIKNGDVVSPAQQVYHVRTTLTSA